MSSAWKADNLPLIYIRAEYKIKSFMISDQRKDINNRRLKC